MASIPAIADTHAEPPLPLVLDLDRTLIRTDVLHEMALTFVKANPLRVFTLARWMLSGRAALKRRLAEAVTIDVDTLPVNEEVAAYAAEAHASGRRVVLATATDSLIARRIARRFAFIDTVVSTEEGVNLKGAVKARRLDEMFPGGFVYAGDGGHDLPVWKTGGAAVVVGPVVGLARRAARVARIERTFVDTGRGKALLKAMRPHQWAKNALVFAPLVLAGLAMQPGAWAAAAAAFAGIGLLASATYILNDLWDLNDDRQHWTKRTRPLASGRLSLVEGSLAVPVLAGAGFAIGALAGPAAVAMLALYTAVTLAYSFVLKRQAMVDAFVLAGLFTLRLGLGMAAVGAPPSAWLLVFSMFLFGSLTCAKRYTEIERMTRRGLEATAGRGYRAADASLVYSFGVASGVGASLIMVLYLMNDALEKDFYAEPAWLWAIPAILFLWVARVWMICLRGELNDDPVVFALRDRTSLCFGAAMGVALVFAVAGVGGGLLT